MHNCVSLITPPSGFLLDERVFMNLGILKVAAVLEQNGYFVEKLDLSGIRNYTEVVRTHMLRTEANIFGLTATTPQLPAAVNIARVIRESHSSPTIILGGPHITLVNTAAKRERKLGIEFSKARGIQALEYLESVFDMLIAGDGEEAMLEALRGYNNGKVIDADEPESALFHNDNQLDELPFPARHLLDIESYHYYIENERALSLIAQLGCPFECGFCGGRQSPFLRRVRMRSSESVVAEMAHLYEKYGVRGMMLYDDELNVNTRMIELMRLIRDKQARLKTQWWLRGFIKAELFTHDQARAMYEAGFRWILIGFESGSPRILKNINKKATLEENSRALQIARRCGLKVKALMSIGHPGESFETVRQTEEWLTGVRPDDFDVSIITTYPGTPYYDFAVPHGEDENIWIYTYKKTGDRLWSFNIDHTQVSDYYKGAPGDYKAYVWTDFLSRDDLVELRDEIENKVRQKLGIPYNPSAPAILYEHSMGLPPHIFRTSYSPSI